MQGLGCIALLRLRLPDSYIKDCLSKKVIFFTGKGGTGKSSLAWATAVACQRQGCQVTLASWNKYPDHWSSPPKLDPGIDWVSLETLPAFREYALHFLKFEKIFDMAFENKILNIFILAAPGLSEVVIAGKIWDLWYEQKKELIIVDLPSSGHVISFFKSPLGIQKIFRFGVVHKNAERICRMFSHPLTRVDLVMLPEELPVMEGLELKQKLSDLHAFRFGFCHMNLWTPELPLPESSVWKDLGEPIKQCCEQHIIRRQQENNALAMAKQLQMPINKLPRFGTDNQVQTIHELADILENM